jgi:hypothetical protein
LIVPLNVTANGDQNPIPADPEPPAVETPKKNGVAVHV